MYKLRNNQAGFGTAGIVAGLVILVAVVTTGILVYRHDHNAAVRDSTTGSTTTTTSPLRSNQQPIQTAPLYLDITQWGVRLTLDRTTASMYYYISPSLPDVAYLSLRTVSNIAPDCAANKVSLGAISRLTLAQHEAR